MNRIVTRTNDTIKLQAVVGLMLTPMKQKSLGLKIHSLDKNGKRQLHPGFVPAPLKIPDDFAGPIVLNYQIAIQGPHTANIYCCDLHDLSGEFGPLNCVLASYLFLVEIGRPLDWRVNQRQPGM